MSEKCDGCDKSHCDTCSSNPKATLRAETNVLNHIKKVIAVVSGKGGVGKSTTCSLLAALTAKKGYKVGVLDADITGPSIPKMFGIEEGVTGDGKLMYPAVKDGIKVMSVNLLLEDGEAPVIWRGPILANVVKQFWTDTVWGELDMLFIDMPPGTGDVPLTVFQSLPVDGIVIVTTPQDLVSLIVKKAFNMARMMNIPVYGIVENMSYALCPDCGKRIDIFGKSRLEEVAADLGVKPLARMPINGDFSSFADRGAITAVETDLLDGAIAAITE